MSKEYKMKWKWNWLRNHAVVPYKILLWLERKAFNETLTNLKAKTEN